MVSSVRNNDTTNRQVNTAPRNDAKKEVESKSAVKQVSTSEVASEKSEPPTPSLAPPAPMERIDPDLMLRPQNEAAGQDLFTVPGPNDIDLETIAPAPPAQRVTPTEVDITRDGDGNTVLDAGDGEDTITVSQLSDGRLEVTTNGETVTLSEEESQNLIIRGGEGNDRIELDANVTQGVRLEGGDGNDKLIGGAGEDFLLGGDGDDYLEGRGGNDNLYGEEGKDTLYGLDGNDILYGGAGQDYIDGGANDDYISGGDGDDVLIGGKDDDTIQGGRGSDFIAGSSGVDRLYGGSGTDEIYKEAHDLGHEEPDDNIHAVDTAATNGTGGPLGESITVTGSPEFQARVESDLEALRSFPEGQDMLASLDDSGHTTTIQETSKGNAASTTGSGDPWLQPDGSPGSGKNAVVSYNPSTNVIGGGAEGWMSRPPLVGFFHELVHANDYVNGTLAHGKTNGVNNRELAAVGLPYDQDGDGTADPNSKRFTENTLRDLLHLPTRPRY